MKVSLELQDYAQEALKQVEAYRKRSGREELTIVIDGMCASGKTTLGELFLQVYGGNLFHMDDFFLQPHQRNAERLRQPGGNVDYERFREEVLNHLKDKEGFSYGIYDCRQQRICRQVKVEQAAVNIMEGSYSAHPYFEEMADLYFFLEIEKEEQIRRIRNRNGEAMLERFQKEWIPMENQYFKAFGIREKSICLKTDKGKEKE